jgi:dolichol-phosphate mannosyltransferase
MNQINKEENFISAVVYCYNNAGAIGHFIQGLHLALDKHFKKYEIVVVNDASTDGCIKEVRDYAAGQQNLVLSVLNMSYHQGQEASMNAGVDLSIGDFVYEFDSVCEDFGWELLYYIYRHSLEGYDIVSARRDEKPDFMSRVYYRLFNKYAHLPFNVGVETFRLVSRRAINRVYSMTQTIPFRKAAYANSGLNLDVIEYKAVTDGDKKRPQRLAGVVDSLILFTDVAYRITLGLALSMFILFLTFVIYAVVYRILSNPVEGWATTVIFSSIGFSGLFAILAMVIKYLQTLVQLVFKKKDYIFESIEKLQ